MVEAKIIMGFGAVGVGLAKVKLDDVELNAVSFDLLSTPGPIGADIKPERSNLRVFLAFANNESLKVIRNALDEIEKKILAEAENAR